MDIALPQLLAIEDYDENEGKLAASIRWLISRVYEEKRDMPDKLRDGVQRDENGHFQISEAVLGALCNGSLYAQAAAKIFKESALVAKSHGAVLAALTDYGIDVLHRPEEGSTQVEESQLVSTNPFSISAHLSIIDALMMAHLRDVIPVTRVVESVSRHTFVEPSERPIDSIDALLFWINKMCLLVRDEVERHDAELQIPEMEDLYEDISDGQCLCALAHWYRPQEMPISDISFNEAATTRDCQYNLMLLQHFCHHHLATDPFHFEIEDLLYLRDSLQMNVNAFLADLFLQFEPPLTPEPVETPRVGPSPRRFVPASAIPDLRAANAAARSSMTIRNRPRMATNQIPGNQMTMSQTPTRSTSRMSQDSLFYSRPASIVLQRRSMDHDPNVTDFQSIRQTFENPAGAAQLSRYDGSVSSSVRLAMEEKRRKHDQQMAQMNSANENERLEKSKAAFFALRKNEEPQGNGKDEWYDRFEAKIRALEIRVGLEEGEEGPQSSRLNRALSQPSVVQGANAQYSGGYMTLPMNTGNQMSQSFVQHPQTPYDYYMQQQQQQQSSQNNYASPSQLRSSLSNGMINHAGYMMQPMYQPEYQQQMQMQQGQVPPVQQMGTYTPEGYFIPHQMQPIPVPQGYTQMGQAGMPYNPLPGQANYMENVQPIGYVQTSNKPIDMDLPLQQHLAQNAFHLHSKSDDANQADPSLEINRNLTNWGMNLAQGGTPQRSQRRTWQNETFIKNELDLVNSRDAVPHVTDETTTQPEDARKFHDYSSNDIRAGNVDHGRHNNMNDHDDLPLSQKSDDSTSGAAQPSFVVTEGDDNENEEKIANERRIAKKAALIAKTMKRKEEIETKVDIAEQRNAERRQMEMEKKELALRKKLEKEQQRQKILDEYKRKKLEKELGAELSTSRTSARGHSQPPFVRTKSQMSEVIDSKQNTPRLRGQSSVEQRVSVSSLAEPTHKLFAKTVTKSNRGLINNALQFSVFPGAVNNSTRQATITQMASSSSKHFLILFRDQKCQYRGLYTWDEVSDTATKISGQGPPKCTESMMNMMFKYDSGGKTFTQIATKHLSATIDGFAINDQFWQKARIPHSGNATHRNN